MNRKHVRFASSAGLAVILGLYVAIARGEPPHSDDSPDALLVLVEQAATRTDIPATAEPEQLLHLIERASADTQIPVQQAALEFSASQSLGLPHAGRLRDGVVLPRHRGYVVRDPARSFAIEETTHWLIDAFDAVYAADPRTPPVMIHDLSLPQGGPMRGHRSHQSGRDVDLAYFRKDCKRACPMTPVLPTKLDTERQWRFLRHLLDRQRVEFVFIDYRLQERLYEHAARLGAARDELSAWFQFPRGSRYPGGTIRHVDNHRDHAHIRFVCPNGDRECRSTRPHLASAAPEALAAPSWLELLETESEDDDSDALLELLQGDSSTDGQW